MIHVATTTIRVLRVPADPTRDPLDPQPSAAQVVAGVRAVISSPNGRATLNSGGVQEVVEFHLSSDPCDVEGTDLVEDESTGLVYQVTWARLREGMGLDHMEGGLRQVAGLKGGAGWNG